MEWSQKWSAKKMKKSLLLEIKEEARNDILNAAAWYREKQEGLDKKFITAVQRTLIKIVNNPESGNKIYKTYRQTIVKKFPYVVIYSIIFDSIVILQVFNTWQNPKKKLKGLKK